MPPCTRPCDAEDNSCSILKMTSNASELGRLLQERMEASCSSFADDVFLEASLLGALSSHSDNGEGAEDRNDSEASFEEVLGEWHSLSVLPVLGQSTNNNMALRRKRSGSDHCQNLDKDEKDDKSSANRERKSRSYSRARSTSPRRARSSSATHRSSRPRARCASRSRRDKKTGTSNQTKQNDSSKTIETSSLSSHDKESKRKDKEPNKMKDSDHTNRYRRRSQSRNPRRPPAGKPMEDHSEGHCRHSSSSSHHKQRRRRRASFGSGTSAAAGFGNSNDLGGSSRGVSPACTARANRRQAGSTSHGGNAAGSGATTVKATAARRRRDTVGRDMLVRNLGVMDQMQQQNPHYLVQQHKFRLLPPSALENAEEGAAAVSVLASSGEVWAKRRAAAVMRQQS